MTQTGSLQQMTTVNDSYLSLSFSLFLLDFKIAGVTVPNFTLASLASTLLSTFRAFFAVVLSACTRSLSH